MKRSNTTEYEEQPEFGRTWWGAQWIGALERFVQPFKWGEIGRAHV